MREGVFMSLIKQHCKFRGLNILAFVIVLILPTIVFAHNVSRRDATFVQANSGRAVAPFLYLGAKHMVTGYDHLLFLVGVIFFLYRLKDVVQYVSLFTIGHSITLLAGVLGNIHASSGPASIPSCLPVWAASEKISAA
jgi:hypothetical protein